MMKNLPTMYTSAAHTGQTLDSFLRTRKREVVCPLHKNLFIFAVGAVAREFSRRLGDRFAPPLVKLRARPRAKNGDRDGGGAAVEIARAIYSSNV